jgi:hypothetical protein
LTEIQTGLLKKYSEKIMKRNTEEERKIPWNEVKEGEKFAVKDDRL